MRPFRYELASVLAVLAVPLALAVVFPYSAVSFRATQPAERVPFAAFVKLTPEAEQVAIREAKTSWQVTDGDVRHRRVEMSLGELPEMPHSSVLSVSDRRRIETPADIPCGVSPFLPSRRASPPEKIASERTEEAPLAFPRKELLKLD